MLVRREGRIIAFYAGVVETRGNESVGTSYDLVDRTKWFNDVW